jgi:hypothetical protein
VFVQPSRLWKKIKTWETIIEQKARYDMTTKCGALDRSLEQKEGTNEKTGEIYINLESSWFLKKMQSQVFKTGHA